MQTSAVGLFSIIRASAISSTALTGIRQASRPPTPGKSRRWRALSSGKVAGALKTQVCQDLVCNEGHSGQRSAVAGFSTWNLRIVWRPQRFQKPLRQDLLLEL